MSTHKSLKLGNNLVGRRSVLSRIERIKKLEERGKWSEGDSVFGLPMTRTQFKVRKGKKKKDEEQEKEASTDAAESTDS